VSGASPAGLQACGGKARASGGRRATRVIAEIGAPQPGPVWNVGKVVVMFTRKMRAYVEAKCVVVDSPNPLYERKRILHDEKLFFFFFLTAEDMVPVP